MANSTTPAFKYNGPAIEAFVPTDSGSTIRVPKDKYVAGSYYNGNLTAPSWTKIADASTLDPNDIVYENMGELGNKLVFVPVPAAVDAAGSAGDIAVTFDSVSGDINALYLCLVTGTPLTTPPSNWLYAAPTTFPA